MIPYSPEQISRIDRFIKAFDLGVVYFIAADAAGPVKIGRSTLLSLRLVSLQIGNPNQLHVFGAFIFPGGHRHVVEQMLHGELEAFWLRGEWFALPVEEAIQLCRRAIRRRARAREKVKATPKEPKPRKQRRGPNGTEEKTTKRATNHRVLKELYKKRIAEWSRLVPVGPHGRSPSRRVS